MFSLNNLISVTQHEEHCVINIKCSRRQFIAIFSNTDCDIHYVGNVYDPDTTIAMESDGIALARWSDGKATISSKNL